MVTILPSPCRRCVCVCVPCSFVFCAALTQTAPETRRPHVSESRHLSRLKREVQLDSTRPDTEEEYVPNFRCSDGASGNGPVRLPGAADVRFQPGAQLQSGGRPLRRLLEPDQHQVSGPTRQESPNDPHVNHRRPQVPPDHIGVYSPQ